jgi:hypothetical protein
MSTGTEEAINKKGIGSLFFVLCSLYLSLDGLELRKPVNDARHAKNKVQRTKY